ncbi:MAG: hypothetical protein PHT88_03450 [Candidatus Moranbacteria bacterium]|nr:hypothetical protein [Candidatus Moranbacteria bacterium]
MASTLSCFFASPFSAWADEDQKGISVSPMFQEISLGEGQSSQTFSIEAFNTTDTLITLRLSVLDFGSLDESGGVAFLGAEQNFEKQYSIASWIRLDRDALVLGPGESQSVQVTFENRDSLSPGGHYGAVVFKVENSGSDTVDENGKSKIAISQSFSSLVFAKKVGGVLYDLNMRSVERETNWFHLPASITTRFQNKGNVHVVPRGTIVVTDPLGKVVQKGVINPESAIILPETFRSYVTRPVLLGAALVPGYYTLTTQYRYDGRDDVITHSFRFTYVPFFEIVPMIVLLGGFVWWRKKKVGAEKSKVNRSA